VAHACCRRAASQSALARCCAEVSKLEDMLKAVKRVKAVREEVIALLVYNISASEGQDLRSNVEAAEMQKRVRTERMESMKKKVKAEEGKMKQAAETFATTAARYKSKISELEAALKAADADIGVESLQSRAICAFSAILAHAVEQATQFPPSHPAVGDSQPLAINQCEEIVPRFSFDFIFTRKNMK
jgi:hypothetical protein